MKIMSAAARSVLRNQRALLGRQLVRQSSAVATGQGTPNSGLTPHPDHASIPGGTWLPKTFLPPTDDYGNRECDWNENMMGSILVGAIWTFYVYYDEPYTRRSYNSVGTHPNSVPLVYRWDSGDGYRAPSGRNPRRSKHTIP